MNRIVSVTRNSVFQLVGDGINRLVPADALELTLAALAHALHRVEQAVRRIDPAAHAAAAQAGARLEIRITRVVGFHVLDLPVFGMPLEHAVAAAVDVALTPIDLFGAGGFVRLRLNGVFRKRNGAADARERR